MEKSTNGPILVILLTYIFFLVLYTFFFIQFTYFPLKGESLDARSIKTWTTELTIADNRPGFHEPLIRKVSFPNLVITLFVFLLLSLAVIVVFGLFRLWELTQIILGIIFFLFPWSVLWMTYKTIEDHHILEFRLYPVMWSYVMGVSALYCISTMIPGQQFAKQLNQLFAEDKLPFLYAITGLLVLVAIQILVVGTELPVPVDVNQTPLDWKKWVISHSVVGWLHGIVMLAWSQKVKEKS